jgi:hypothetical protein
MASDVPVVVANLAAAAAAPQVLFDTYISSLVSRVASYMTQLLELQTLQMTQHLELMTMLAMMWMSTTLALVVFILFFFCNKAENFHPHSVGVDRRHALSMFVTEATICKPGHMVASVSAFVAPRGSSASKYFTVLTVSIAMSGFFASLKWCLFYSLCTL